MVDTGLNIHVSRCVSPDCEYGFDNVIEARCMDCKHRVPVVGKDEVALSLSESIDVDVDERTDEEMAYIINTHCKKCDQYIEADDICQSATCGCREVVQDTIKSLRAHCPDGVW